MATDLYSGKFDLMGTVNQLAPLLMSYLMMKQMGMFGDGETSEKDAVSQAGGLEGLMGSFPGMGGQQAPQMGSGPPPTPQRSGPPMGMGVQYPPSPTPASQGVRGAQPSPGGDMSGLIKMLPLLISVLFPPAGAASGAAGLEGLMGTFPGMG